MNNVAVLGCGPAGLLVAHAAKLAGWEPDIFSIKQKSPIPGCQHLQGPIPEITAVYPDSAMTFVKIGTGEGYAQKVYGDYAHPTGWDNYHGTYKSWSVYDAYDKLWDLYSGEVIEKEIATTDLHDLLGEWKVVLSTLPMPYLCHKGHNFESVPYWLKILPTPEGDDREIIVFNGLPLDSWYRWSIVGGRCSMEGTWSPPVGAVEGVKAIDNDCDCWPGLHRLGRWAKWKHGVLLHHAFADAQEIIHHTIGINKGAEVGRAR